MKKFRSMWRGRSVLALALVLLMLGGTGVLAAGVTYTDVAGHWSQAMVEDAAANGLDMLTGDQFKPNEPITREQFTHMVNWAFGLTTEAETLPFTDIEADDVYAADISIAYRAKYVGGRSETEFDPYSPLTRQEAAVILSRLIPLYGVEATGKIETFTDYGTIATWAQDAMGKMTTKGYFDGYPDLTIRPLGTLTNAEALALLTRIVADVTINSKDFTVSAGDVYENTVYTGTITVPAGYRVTFRNCVILGTLVSKTTEEKTNWALEDETTVANVEYAEEAPSTGGGSSSSRPDPEPDPDPEPEPEPEPEPGGDDDVFIEFG